MTMSGTVLMAYGSKHGSTQEVAHAVAEELEAHGVDVETIPAREVEDLRPYTGVVVGGSIYMGRWHADAIGLLERHKYALSELPLAVFGMGPRTLEPHDVEHAQAELHRSLATVPEVEPRAVAIFGGVINPRSLRFPFSRMPASDARDWAAIRAWPAGLVETFDYGKPASDPRDLRTELQQTHR
jgi:menaquinone-dependent protoporphyrinogen oxidase